MNPSTEHEKNRALLDEVLWNRDVDRIRELLQSGADVNAKDECLGTVLHIAAKNLSRDIVDKFVSQRSTKANDEAENDETVGSNVPAAAAPKIELSLEMIETAVRRGADTVELLLQYGADVHAETKYLSTPLHLAAMNHESHAALGHIAKKYKLDAAAPDARASESVRDAITRAAVRTMELLLSKGARVNARNVKRATPLHSAIGYPCDGMSSVVKVLLEHGAMVNAEAVGRQTPLQLAVGHCKGSLATVELLLEHGANANADCSMLRHAVSNGSPDVAQLLLEHGADANARDGEGNTVLHKAMFWSASFDRRTIGLLVKHGAQLECRNKSGQTPAHKMCQFMRTNFRYSYVKSLLNALTELFSHGADINAKDQNGDTPYNLLKVPREVYSLDSLRVMLAGHAKKLAALGAARVAEKNRALFLDVMNRSRDSWDTLARQSRIDLTEIQWDEKYFYEKCLSELDKLKAVRIFRNVSMADVLSLGEPATLAKIAGNADFRRHAESDNAGSEFPIYLFLIKLQYQRGLQMKELCEKCEKSLEMLTTGKLGADCVHKIVQYLSEVDLKNLNGAMKNEV